MFQFLGGHSRACGLWSRGTRCMLDDIILQLVVLCRSCLRVSHIDGMHYKILTVLLL